MNEKKNVKQKYCIKEKKIILRCDELNDYVCMEVLSGNRECVPNSIYVLYTCTYEALKEIETYLFSFSLALYCIDC